MIIKNKKALGTLIRTTRLIQGLTTTKLAIKANMKQSVISSIETGKSNITLETIMRVARALNLNLNIDFKEGV